VDCGLRYTPIELKDFELVLRGPERLVRNQGCWPSTDFEAKGAKSPVLERFSTISQALRITGCIMRFKDNASGKVERRFGPLSIEELDYALLAVVRIAQRESFATDLSAVMNSKRLPSRSKLLNLSPILEEGILRVRGRLRHWMGLGGAGAGPRTGSNVDYLFNSFSSLLASLAFLQLCFVFGFT